MEHHFRYGYVSGFFPFGIFIIYQALAQDISVPGWASLMVSIYFVGGLTY